MANPLLLGGIFDIAVKVIDRVFPDKTQAAEAKLKLIEMDQKGELAQMASQERLMLSQVEVNKLDAQASSSFQRNWRPFIGWNCGLGFSYEFLARPFLVWVSQLYGPDTPIPPSLDAEALMALTASILGIGVYRTAEKIKGAVK